MSKGLPFLLILSLTAALVVAACTHQRPTPEARLKQGAAEMRSAITAAVVDPVRRGQLIERADQLERVLAGYVVEYEAFEDKLHQANRSYDTPPAQIKALFTQFEQKR